MNGKYKCDDCVNQIEDDRQDGDLACKKYHWSGTGDLAPIPLNYDLWDNCTDFELKNCDKISCHCMNGGYRMLLNQNYISQTERHTTWLNFKDKSIDFDIEGDKPETLEGFKISYCPICGRKFKSEAET